MYLNENQLKALLEAPYFSSPSTESWIHYEFYRGQLDTSVLTLRFNITDTFSENFILDTLLEKIIMYFPLNSRILASLNYDVVLRDPESNPVSFYIWKANSNQHCFDRNTEIVVVNTYANVARYARGIQFDNINDLNINFRHSRVIVDRLLSVVCSFMLVKKG